MNKKVLVTTVLLLLVVLGVAAKLYPILSAKVQSQPVATVQTEATAPTETLPPETTAATETEAEPTEPIEDTEATEEIPPEPIPAPDFTVQDWDGNEARLHDYLGKPIVLNFWAHWCDPCAYEMPGFNAVYEALDGEVVFLMVHEGPGEEKAKKKVTDNGYTFPVVFDAYYSAGGIYGAYSYPMTFFIDDQGDLKAYYPGAMSEELLWMGIDLIYTVE